MIKEGEIELLNQLAESLEKAEARMEYALKSQGSEEFSKIKRFILEIQNKISEIVKQ